jgi:hypothetical protein
MPDGSPRIPNSTFNTLHREQTFRHPPEDGHAVPILNEFVTPILESFNALFDDSKLPHGDGDGRGLLSLGIEGIGERVVFDGKGDIGSESGQRGWGNRLTSACVFYIFLSNMSMWIIDSVVRANFHCTSHGVREGPNRQSAQSLSHRG